MSNSIGLGGGTLVAANTVSARIDAAIEQSEARLAAAKKARDILNQHPEIEELINLLQRF